MALRPGFALTFRTSSRDIDDVARVYDKVIDTIARDRLCRQLLVPRRVRRGQRPVPAARAGDGDRPDDRVAPFTGRALSGRARSGSLLKEDR
jgi:hypothetical protein